MRPVNLIPPEDRRGDQRPLRTGFLVYLVVGALAAVLVGVVALVLVGNTISERRNEVATLKVEDAAAARKAEELAAYIQFRSLSEQRVETVRSLADSRFDWERVMRELSLILPGDVWLVELNASAAPGVDAAGSGGGSGLRAGAKGPALEINGCTTGQAEVAAFVTSLKDIDGVTRVGVQSSELPDPDGGAGVNKGGEADSANTNTDCRTRKFIAKFEIVVAFDAAPVPVVGSSGEGSAPADATEQAEGTSEEQQAANQEPGQE